MNKLMTAHFAEPTQMTEAEDIAHIAFVGGEDSFRLNLQKWLCDHFFSRARLEDPTPDRVVACSDARANIRAIAETMLAGDTPEGMHYAQVGPMRDGDILTTFVPGKDIAFYDALSERMALHGRRVGMAPAELAQRGGWL